MEMLDRIAEICAMPEETEGDKKAKSELKAMVKAEIGLNLGDNTVKVEVGFPNKHWFSDHLPVGAKLLFQ